MCFGRPPIIEKQQAPARPSSRWCARGAEKATGPKDDGEEDPLGHVRASGVYVKEDGSGVGSVQQIDLAV